MLFLAILRNRDHPVEEGPHLHLPRLLEEAAVVHGQPQDPLGVSHQHPDPRRHKLFPLPFNRLLSLPLRTSHPVGAEVEQEDLVLNSRNNSSKAHSSRCTDRGVSRLAVALCRPEPPTAIRSLYRNKDQSQAYGTLSLLILLQHRLLNNSSSNTMLRTTVLGLPVITSHPPLLHTRPTHKHQWGPVVAAVVGGML